MNEICGLPIYIDYTSRKKTISLQIKDDHIRILAPKHLSNTKIYEVIQAKQQWVKRKLIEKRSNPEYQDKKYIEGEEFLFQGETYVLKYVTNKHVSSEVSDVNADVKSNKKALRVKIPPWLSQEEYQLYAQQAIKKWFKMSAHDYLLKRTHYFSKKMGVSPRTIHIKHYKSRWGACSPQGDIYYNWKIIMAPKIVIDYLIIHELSHIIEHNHSPQYWEQVAVFDGDFKAHRRWLKEMGHMLHL